MASIAKDHGKTRDPEKSRAAVSRKLTHLLFPRLERLTRALSRTSLQLWLFLPHPFCLLVQADALLRCPVVLGVGRGENWGEIAVSL